MKRRSRLPSTLSGPAWLVQVFTRCLVLLPTTGSRHEQRSHGSRRILSRDATLMDVDFGSVACRGRHLLRGTRGTVFDVRIDPAFYEKRRMRINQTGWKTDTC